MPEYNYGARPVDLRRPRYSPYRNMYAPMGQMPEINQETLVKWVVVPGATMAVLWIITRVLRRRRKGRRR